jgi:predicted PurR-regulated permease PerM
MDPETTPEMNVEWSKPTKYIVSVGLFIFGVVILYVSRSVIPLLLMSALLALVLRPVILGLRQRLKMPRTSAVLVTYLLAMSILLTIPLILATQAVRVVNFFMGLDYFAVVESTLIWLEGVLAGIRDLPIPVFERFVDSSVDAMLESLKNAESLEISTAPRPAPETVFETLIAAFTVSYDFAVGLVGGVASSVLALIFFVLTSIYLSLDGHKFWDAAVKSVPPAYKPEIESLVVRIERVWTGFFRGQVTLMIIVGTAVWLGGAAVGLPFAFVLGVIAGLLEVLPNLGPTLATIPAVFIALVMGPSYYEMNHVIFALIVVGFYVLINFLENSFIVPNVLGEAVDIHPILVLTGVMVGAAKWGILGALLAAPMIATVKEIVGYLYFKILWEAPEVKYESPVEEAPPSLWKRISGMFRRQAKEGKGKAKVKARKPRRKPRQSRRKARLRAVKSSGPKALPKPAEKPSPAQAQATSGSQKPTP